MVVVVVGCWQRSKGTNNGFQLPEVSSFLAAASIIGKAPRPLCFLEDELWQGENRASGQVPLFLLCPFHCSSPSPNASSPPPPPSHPRKALDPEGGLCRGLFGRQSYPGLGVGALMLSVGLRGPALLYATLICGETS